MLKIKTKWDNDPHSALPPAQRGWNQQPARARHSSDIFKNDGQCYAIIAASFTKTPQGPQQFLHK